MYAPPKHYYYYLLLLFSQVICFLKREEERGGKEGKNKQNILIVVLVTRVFRSVSTPPTYLNTLTQTLWCFNKIWKETVSHTFSKDIEQDGGVLESI